MGKKVIDAAQRKADVAPKYFSSPRIETRTPRVSHRMNAIAAMVRAARPTRRL
jgi:hypothetical protein